MDPDATLADILHTIKEWELGNTDLDYELLLEQIQALDNWIVKDGFLPERWKK